MWSKANSLCASGSLCDLRLMILPVFNIISCPVRLVHGSGSRFSVNTSLYCSMFLRSYIFVDFLESLSVI